LKPIAVPYLLVSGLPCYIFGGRRWTDALWHKDLVEHLRYLTDFTLASPVLRSEPPAAATCLSDDPRFAGVRYVDLPASNSELAGVLNWPRTFVILWRAAGRARMIHAGVADWPIPTGWAATLAARLRGRALLINIESAFWRVPASASFVKRFRARVWEIVNRWCVRQASLPLFTQHEYARQMLPHPERGHVFQASWIDEDVVLDPQAATESWEKKSADRPRTILFAGRLIADKGLLDLLEAMTDETLGVQLDIIGDGELSEKVAEATHRNASVRRLEPVPYGPEFFALVRQYDAVVVPSRSDEQPRIVYDAYSQAVPILGTRTPGIEACVVDGETGRLVAPGSVEELRELLRHADRPSLRKMGLRALDVARRYTHREMHRRRWRLLSETLGD
jgi:glycosyltransferase involved in cell wall biosynthesis